MRLLLGLILALTGAVVAQEQETPQFIPIPSKDSNPYVARIYELEHQLADTQATLLKRDIELSTCKATTDSVVLSGRAKELLETFKRVYGGEWVWDAQAGQPVRPEKKEQK